MTRVTAVVSGGREASETFVAAFVDAVSARGHQVAVHEMWPTVGAVPRDHHGALPPLRSLRFAPAVLRLLAASPAAVAQVAWRACRAFGAGPRALRAALLAAPIAATAPDLVYVAFSGIAVTLNDALELLRPVPVIVSCRGSAELVVPVVEPARRAALVRALHRATAVHAVAGSVAAAVADMGVDRDRVVVIRPAVDVERFSRRTAVRPVGEPLLLVTVARLHWVKGIEDLLDAVAMLRRHGLDVRLRVVGDGPSRDPLRFRAHALGVADHVELVGARAHDEVARMVEEADVFVLSSLSEGISNVVLEALALEVPVVTTDVSGMPEVIRDGVDGLLVGPGDPAAIAAAVRRLLGDPDLARRLAAAGRARVVEEHSLPRLQREVASLVATTLAAGMDRSAEG